MNLLDVVNRVPQPEPWAEGDKIPWHDADFSRRMLREHLSQEHDAASRRLATIEQHVAWMHRQLPADRPTRILDLGCGPGLYCSALSRLGHTCVGIDFAPAAIAHARAQAEREGLRCTYLQEDVRSADFGTDYGLVVFIFGEFNMFRPNDARLILRKAQRALVPAGLLLLEVHALACVQRIGKQQATWYAAQEGLFSDRPHLCLNEGVWNEAAQVAIERYYVVDAQTGAVTRHASSMQAYTEDGYRTLLAECGFSDVQFLPSLCGNSEPQGDLFVIVARE